MSKSTPYICAAAVLGFLAAVILMTSAPAIENAPTPADTVIDNELLKVLISESLTKSLPVRDVSAVISGDGRISLSGTVKPRELADLMKKNGTELPSAVKLFLRLLPESSETSAVFRLYVDTEKKTLGTDIEKLSVNGMDISGALIPESVQNAVSGGINRYLARGGIRLGAVEFRDGEIRIENTP